MAEAIGLTASIIAIVQIAGTITTICKSFIDSVQDYPKDLRLIYVETSSLVVVFEGLKLLDPKNTADATSLAIVLAPDGPVECCRAALARLEQLLSSESIHHPDAQNEPMTKKRRIKASLASLAWPLKATKAKEILAEVMQHKATISLALAGETLKGIQKVQQTVDQIQKDLSEDQRRQVCSWFRQIDPSILHNSAIGLYEPGTADWVSRCEQWQDWIQLKSRCLWVHGIPGAGKTVLASHLIEELKAHCANDQDHALFTTYYYCYHGHNQDETIPLLRWMISDLFRRTDVIPQQAYSMFQQGHAPSLKDLLGCLSAVLQLCALDAVFVVIDALDESQERHNLLKLLQNLASDNRFKKLQLLATSREYIEIEQAMLPISEEISMSENANVQEDIRRVVKARINSHPKFQRWSSSLCVEVEDALSAGARGMFRWAVCQLDILQRLPNNPDRIRNAIKSLPRTLDETYERIFSMIRDEEKLLVRHALHWLMITDTIKCDNTEFFLSAQELADTCSILDIPGGNSYGPFDISTLQESCGCLIRFVPFQWKGRDEAVEKPTIAHYTVREYLESERSSTACSSFFRVEQSSYMDTLLVMFRTTAIPHKNWNCASLMSAANKLKSFCGYILALAFQNERVFDQLLFRKHTTKVPQPILEFFNPSCPEFSFLAHTLAPITFAEGLETEYNQTAFLLVLPQMDSPHLEMILGNTVFWMLAWPAPPQKSTLGIVLNILTLGLEHEDSRLSSLAYRLIERDKSLLWMEFTVMAPIVWSAYPCAVLPPETDTPFHKLATSPITGKLPEVLAQLGNRNALQFLLASFAKDIDITSTLLYSIIMSGSVFTQEWHVADLSKGPLVDFITQRFDSRTLKELDCRPSYVTPLQLAIAVGSEVVVKHLLEAGADPNELGSTQCLPWGQDSTLFRCNRLHHHSPLNIARTSVLNKPVTELEIEIALWEGWSYHIQELLLEYGATDFVRDEVQTSKRSLSWIDIVMEK